MINVTIYNEYFHEQEYEGIRKVYPQGIHNCIKDFLQTDENLSIKIATFEMENHGLSPEVLAQTDVLIFWSHAKQDEFSDKVAENIKNRVLDGMGFLPLHSAHFSKPMKLLMGTTMSLKWKHDESEKLFCTCPTHPIAAGLPEEIKIPKEEMYGEYFDIPKPDDVIYTGWFSNGHVFRSACTWTRGKGKIFYFQPGHEEYPVYFQKEIQQIIKNGIYWCSPANSSVIIRDCIEVK